MVQKPIEPLLTIAKQAGFSKETFDTCLKNQKLLETMKRAQSRLEKFGVNSTPTFFINGKIAPRRHVDRRNGEAHRALS